MTYSYKEAGLPNITGKLRNDHIKWNYSFGGEWNLSTVSQQGALHVQSSYYGSQVFETQGDWGGGYLRELSFDASKSNKIYGRSITVQPSAMTVNYYIKAK